MCGWVHVGYLRPESCLYPGDEQYLALLCGAQYRIHAESEVVED